MEEAAPVEVAAPVEEPVASSDVPVEVAKGE